MKIKEAYQKLQDCLYFLLFHFFVQLAAVAKTLQGKLLIKRMERHLRT